MVAEGEDPRTPIAAVPTFADALETVIGLHRDNWKDGGKTESLWRRSLGDYAIPTLGRKLVSEITSADVLAVLAPIWAHKRPTAMKVRRRVSAVMRWAIVEGHRDDNPAGDAITAALPRGGHTTNHLRGVVVRRCWDGYHRHPRQQRSACYQTRIRAADADGLPQ